MATREAIMTALFAKMQTISTFAVASRRNREPETIGPSQSPALFLLEDAEHYEVPGVNMPPKRHLLVSVILYNDIGPTDPNAIPASAINSALDALDSLLANRGPDGLYNLGGLVASVSIDGEVKKAPGDKTGKSVAIVPLRITIP